MQAAPKAYQSCARDVADSEKRVGGWVGGRGTVVLVIHYGSCAAAIWEGLQQCAAQQRT
jgi:hypothetical protein